MKYLIIALMVLTSTANAQNSCKMSECSDLTKAKRECVVKEDCEPKIKYLNKEVSELKKEIEELKRQKEALQQSYDDALVAITMKEHKEAANKNSVSILGAMSENGVSVDTSNPNQYKASSTYKPDAGLMYQRDFPAIRGSIGATLNGTFLLGAGLTF